MDKAVKVDVLCAIELSSSNYELEQMKVDEIYNRKLFSENQQQCIWCLANHFTEKPQQLTKNVMFLYQAKFLYQTHKNPAFRTNKFLQHCTKLKFYLRVYKTDEKSTNFSSLFKNHTNSKNIYSLNTLPKNVCKNTRQAMKAYMTGLFLHFGYNAKSQ